jgi:hypothetical protein
MESYDCYYKSTKSECEKNTHCEWVSGDYPEIGNTSPGFECDDGYELSGCNCIQIINPGPIN